LNFIISNNIKATILTIILLSGGVIAITSPVPPSAEAEIYQNAICSNVNFNLNHIKQVQLQNQEDSQTTTNGQQPNDIERLNSLDSGGLLSNMEDRSTDANIDGEPVLNLEKNIVNVCINDNDNFLGAELVGGQEQIEPPQPIPPSAFLDLAVANVFSDNVSVLLGDATDSFGTATNYDTGDAPSSVAIGDFNGNGVLDLAISNILSNSVSILLGNGDGTFGTANSFSTGNSPYAVAIGDFNGDGILDLVIANENSNSNSVSILLGNGDGTFGTANSFSTGGTTPRFVAVGEFNGDDVFDLAVANTGSHDLGILLGNGDGTFDPANNFPTGEESFPAFVAVGDFNGDNVLDLVTVYDNSGEPNSNSVSILLGNGDGTFGTAKHFRVGTSPMAVAVEDFNDDKVLDLAVANSGSAGSVSILLGNGDGTFGTANGFGGGSSPRSIAVGDFNNDRKLDLVTANESSNTVTILLGNGDGTFGPSNSFPVGDRPFSVAVGNFN
jgi:hypothetical protein